MTGANKFAQLTVKYESFTSAEALFFHSPTHKNVKALRMLVPAIEREFTDNAYIGTGTFSLDLEGLLLIDTVLLRYRPDPEGYLYYNDEASLDTAIYYRSERVINPKDNKVCALITFSATQNGAALAEV